mmetsp:Transcript_55924/g.166365  ORF Transcript_55924/g.166365 Transcript_55924/m.166365 type:complete len:253 (-) Transcript_55924:279-1037(-)
MQSGECALGLWRNTCWLIGQTSTEPILAKVMRSHVLRLGVPTPVAGAASGYPEQSRRHQSGSTGPAPVVGIAGATRLGKSSPARLLAEDLGAGVCAVVAQDNCRRTGSKVAVESWIDMDGTWPRNRETPNQTDWPALERDVERAASNARIVLVEGFCLLHSHRLCRLLHGLIWVEIDAVACKSRRRACPKGGPRLPISPSASGPRMSAIRHQSSVMPTCWGMQASPPPSVAGRSSCRAPSRVTSLLAQRCGR